MGVHFEPARIVHQGLLLHGNLFATYGGFGVGSESMYQVGVGPGFVFNDWLTLELYYRHMAVNYENDGFVFDADMSGIFLGIVMKWCESLRGRRN